MGLREQVKKGLISIDEALVVAESYNENIRAWLQRRKKGGVKVKSEKKVGKKKKGKKGKK